MDDVLSVLCLDFPLCCFHPTHDRHITCATHFLLLDGHNSHVTLEVARAAKAVGLDLVSLSSHTSHALQPLDVAVFKPLKGHFREYRDFWMSRNINHPASKEILAQWVSLSLQKALSESNIRSGFRGAGIFPLNPRVVDSYLVPSETYAQEPGVTDEPGRGQHAQGTEGLTGDMECGPVEGGGSGVTNLIT